MAVACCCCGRQQGQWRVNDEEDEDDANATGFCSFILFVVSFSTVQTRA